MPQFNSVIQGKMRSCYFGAVIALLLLQSSQTNAQNFDDCMNEVTTIVEKFSTPEVEEVVVGVLKEELCGEGNAFPNEAECSSSITQRWPDITQLFIEFESVFANETCTQAIPIRLDWNCITCRYRIQGLLSTLRSYTFSRAFRDFALGPAYCEQQDSTAEEQEACKQWIEDYVTKAFAVIRFTPTENICNEIYGECTGEIGCRDGMAEIYKQIGYTDTIERTKTLLKSEVCTQTWVESEEGCKRGVDAHWDRIAAAVSRSGFNFITICSNYFEYFANPAPEATWDCSTCQMRVREMMGFNRNHKIDWIVASVDQVIYGTNICMDAEDKPNGIIACQKYVRAFMPKAVDVLIEDAYNNPDKVCRNVYDFENSCQFIAETNSASTGMAAVSLFISSFLLINQL
ncbi:uncharacterized protein LOC131892419 [Tigriopus californicus]|uniref:uncharacterized protein LOC131892419 n=1 Tax=Tigriopus californicus TaxID=6832 RepID=UPI0027DA3719|nr:uncharacterized protein LOC131892419 [Tigriopus californicus]